ncbi:HD domain-containing protein [Heliobacterium gestii]|uniref:HD domain-containing protein n=1 Tax=Heliomicrobium gestii TaxID=2699 RepID=A0A845LKE0_HELGE|nr:Ppx/GppA phosphatase family protein [Heliomicrobium gestii]MBM7867862.1 exopolyphosphatase/guanosine-5'-triphosphate,3'-diphosphate pyrophosphatase [Heliomicrobium gestii]MZP43326.1 HD domain-containing protein [Heliomicrobium gestii]
MEKVGIMDLGSNSVRLMIVGIAPDGSYKLIDEAKEGVRLSEHMGPEATLKPIAVERTIEALRLFQHLCQAQGITRTVCVATAAVRQASNQREFLEQVKQATGFDFRVLSGREEAEAAYNGVINTIDIDRGIIVDIGGGSTEVIRIENRRMVQSISLPFGAVTLTENRLDSARGANRPGDEQVKNLENYLAEQFAAIEWLKDMASPTIVGLGGTVRNLSKIDRKRKKYSLDITHNYRMAPKDVHEIYRSVKTVSLEQRKKIAGLSKDRADIIVAGLAIVSSLISAAQGGELVVSGSGLRDGLFYQYLLREQPKPIVDDVVRHSVNNLMRYYRLERGHSCHVASLTLSMFDQLKALHEMGPFERRILEVASLLHDVGIQVNYYDHHKHSFYLITSTRLNGLTHREILMAAFVAMAHTKSFSGNLLSYKDILSDEDGRTIRKLGVLLRIAEALERSEAGVVSEVRMHQHVENVHLIARTRDSADLEICDAYKVAPDFKKVFNRNLLVSAQAGG